MSRDALPDEELCIFYGHNLWFQPTDPQPPLRPVSEPEDEWGGLSGIDEGDDIVNGEDRPRNTEEIWSLLDGDPAEVVPEDQLPFRRLKLTPDDEVEEEMSSVRTGHAVFLNIVN